MDIRDLIPFVWKSTPAAMAAHLTREQGGMRFLWPAHVDLLSRKIAEAAMGRCPRLLVTMPPRHGKSHVVSLWAPVWFLENFPHRRVILCSYEAEFAASWGRKVRDTINQYQGELTVRVSATSQAADNWETTAGGGMMTAGTGGPITGKGADLLVIDDPIKNSEEANSETYRRKLWDWWTSTAYTRLEPGGAAVVMHTRWHPQDLAGRLMDEMKNKGGEPWETLDFPAIAQASDVLGRKAGEALWPGRYDVAALGNIRRAVGGYVWGSLYQGRPTAPQGNYFKRQWFEAVEGYGLPVRYKAVCRFWDLAGTVEGEKGNTDPDWTVGVKVGLSHTDVCYVLDVQRARETPAQVQKLIRSTAMKDGPGVRIRMQQDPGQAGKAQVVHYQRNVLAGFDFRGVLRTIDKLTASGPFNAACERGDVKIVKGGWNDVFVEELASFPNSGHDDQVDAAVGAYTDLSGVNQAWDKEALAAAFSYRNRPQEQVEGGPNPLIARMLAGNVKGMN
jgi:predicted phage terminase large subunit-like protein